MTYWPRGTLAERFWAKVNQTPGQGPNGDCWEWAGARRPDKGYGMIFHAGRPINASRAAWIVAHGEIPEGGWVCHRCDNPPCVRLDHLFLGDARENVLDMVRKGRHWCPRGASHPRTKLTPEIAAEIRATHVRGKTRYDPGNTVALARKYGVCRDTVLDVVAGKRWCP